MHKLYYMYIVYAYCIGIKKKIKCVLYSFVDQSTIKNVSI